MTWNPRTDAYTIDLMCRTDPATDRIMSDMGEMMLCAAEVAEAFPYFPIDWESK